MHERVMSGSVKNFRPDLFGGSGGFFSDILRGQGKGNIGAVVSDTLQIGEKLHKKSSDRGVAFASAQTFHMMIFVKFGLIVDFLFGVADFFQQKRVV